MAVKQLVHDEPAFVRPDQHEVALPTRHVVPERHPARRSHRLREKPVGLVAAFVGAEIIRLLDMHEIDAVERDKLDDLEVVRFLFFQGLELVRVEADVLSLGVLVTLDELRPLDDFVIGGAVHLVLDAIPTFLVQLVKLHPFGARSRIDLERYRHEAEGECP